MLDGLETADRATELVTGLGVLGGHFDCAPCPAGLLADQGQRASVQRGIEHLDAGTRPADQTCRGIDELQSALLAGRVDRRQRRHSQAGSTGIDREHGGARIGGGQHVQQFCRLPVEHEMFVAGDVPAVADLTCGRGYPRRQPGGAVFGESDGGDQFTRRDPGQYRVRLCRVAGGGQQAGHQHRGRQERADQQRPAHLFHRNAHFHRARTGAAMLLVDQQSGQAHRRQFMPHSGV